MKLISMTDFVLEQQEQCKFYSDGRFHNRIINYANFLKQPLELSMFIPCDEDGNVLSEPFYNGRDDQYYGAELFEYRKAKERVLFEGFRLPDWIGTDKIYFSVQRENEIILFGNDESIETAIEYNLQLTQTAIKQIGV